LSFLKALVKAAVAGRFLLLLDSDEQSIGSDDVGLKVGSAFIVDLR
jgi:hypothetical protein